MVLAMVKAALFCGFRASMRFYGFFCGCCVASPFFGFFFFFLLCCSLCILYVYLGAPHTFLMIFA
jgi:hypothetical protein